MDGEILCRFSSAAKIEKELLFYCGKEYEKS
jgi:hypothetical protein